MKKSLFFALLCAATALTSTAHAKNLDNAGTWDAKRFQLRARAIGVVPDESSSASIGGDVKVGNAVTPEIDLSYYFNDYISAEVIAATSQHSISHSAAGDLGRAWILPPTVTVQYHPMPTNKFSPYFGAGLNYSMFYGEESAKANGINDLKVNGGFGYAMQVGADYWLDDHWGLNVDVKKLYLNVDAKLNGGAIRADVDLDPWIIGAGVAYRF